MLKFSNPKDDIYLMTLYNKVRFTLNKELTKTLSEVTLDGAIYMGCLPLVFTDNTTNENVLVVNLHALFSLDVVNDIRALQAKAEELGISSITYLGDFNRDLTEQSDEYSRHDVSSKLDDGTLFKVLNARSAQRSSFHSQVDKTTDVETRDGILTTEDDVKINILWNTNRPPQGTTDKSPIDSSLQKTKDFYSSLSSDNENTKLKVAIPY